MRSLISPQLALVLGSMMLWACSDARAETMMYCIGNSLTVNCEFELLDGTIGWNINGGATLKYAYNQTTAESTSPDSGPWREAFGANQYDFVTVQPSGATTLDEDATVIAAWMAIQPDATFILHTGWGWQSRHESEYHGGNPDNLFVHSPEYMADLTAEVAQRTGGRTMVSTRAIDAVDMIYHDIEDHVGPFITLGGIYRDDGIHFNTTGRFLAHNLMRQALGQPLSDNGFGGVPAATRAYLVDIVHAVQVSVMPGPGDANDDGLVDDRDASIVGAHWQTGGVNWSMGDFNSDNVVNDADAAILAAHWGEGGGEESVPEPGSLALLAGIAVMGLVYLRRRHV
jgi:hypothetical protein